MTGVDDIFSETKEYWTRQWHHLGDAIIKMLLQPKERDSDIAKTTIIEFLESPYVFLKCIGLRLLRDTPLFGIDEIFEFLIKNEGELLTDYFCEKQLILLLEKKAIEFSQDQIQHIEEILLKYDDGDTDA